jgi:hypothetical protein
MSMRIETGGVQSGAVTYKDQAEPISSLPHNTTIALETKNQRYQAVESGCQAVNYFLMT